MTVIPLPVAYHECDQPKVIATLSELLCLACKIRGLDFGRICHVVSCPGQTFIIYMRRRMGKHRF